MSSDFEKRFAELVKTHRAMFRQPKPDSLDAKVLGLAEDGKYYILKDGNRIIRGSSTTGAIAVDQCVTYRGMSIDAQRAGAAPKPKPQPLILQTVSSNVKYLYSLTVSGQTQLWVAGWKSSPVMVVSLTSGLTGRSIASIDNLGGNRWRVDVAIPASSDSNTGFTLYSYTSEGNSSALSIPSSTGRGLAFPVVAYLHGYGFGRFGGGALAYKPRGSMGIEGLIAGANINLCYDPPGSYTTSYAINGAVSTITGSITGGGPISSFSASATESPIILSPTVSAGLSSSLTADYERRVSGDCYTIYRSNGICSIGVHTQYSNYLLPSLGAAVPNKLFFVGESIIESPFSDFEYTGGSNYLGGDSTTSAAIIQSNLDVQNDGFTAFSMNGYFPGGSAQSVNVQKYSTNFTANGSAIAVTVYPPSNKDGTYNFLGASYHS